MLSVSEIIELIMSGKNDPWENIPDEDVDKIKELLRKNDLEIRLTPSPPAWLREWDGSDRWYIWPRTKEAAKKWGLPDDIERYLPPGTAKLVAKKRRTTMKVMSYNGQKVVVNNNELLFWANGKYAVDMGKKAAIGEMIVDIYHNGNGDVEVFRGVIPEKWISIGKYRAVRRMDAMTDGEYELAIGEGIPTDSPLLSTNMARSARGKLQAGLAALGENRDLPAP